MSRVERAAGVRIVSVILNEENKCEVLAAGRNTDLHRSIILQLQDILAFLDEEKLWKPDDELEFALNEMNIEQLRHYLRGRLLDFAAVRAVSDTSPPPCSPFFTFSPGGVFPVSRGCNIVTACALCLLSALVRPNWRSLLAPWSTPSWITRTFSVANQRL